MTTVLQAASASARCDGGQIIDARDTVDLDEQAMDEV